VLSAAGQVGAAAMKKDPKAAEQGPTSQQIALQSIVARMLLEEIMQPRKSLAELRQQGPNKTPTPTLTQSDIMALGFLPGYLQYALPGGSMYAPSMVSMPEMLAIMGLLTGQTNAFDSSQFGYHPGLKPVAKVSKGLPDYSLNKDRDIGHQNRPTINLARSSPYTITPQQPAGQVGYQFPNQGTLYYPLPVYGAPIK